MSKELKIDESSYLMLLNKFLKNKEEERDLALDRYRKADESIETNDHFMLLGKNAALFLRQASDATNDIANLAKEIKSIIFKESDNSTTAGAGQSADQMRAIIDLAKEVDSEESKNLDETTEDPEEDK